MEGAPLFINPREETGSFFVEGDIGEYNSSDSVEVIDITEAVFERESENNNGTSASFRDHSYINLLLPIEKEEDIYLLTSESGTNHVIQTKIFDKPLVFDKGVITRLASDGDGVLSVVVALSSSIVNGEKRASFYLRLNDDGGFDTNVNVGIVDMTMDEIKSTQTENVISSMRPGEILIRTLLPSRFDAYDDEIMGIKNGFPESSIGYSSTILGGISEAILKANGDLSFMISTTPEVLGMLGVESLLSDYSETHYKLILNPVQVVIVPKNYITDISSDNLSFRVNIPRYVGSIQPDRKILDFTEPAEVNIVLPLVPDEEYNLEPGFYRSFVLGWFNSSLVEFESKALS